MTEIRLAKDQMSALLDEIHDLKRVILASCILGRTHGVIARGSIFVEADEFLDHKYPPQKGTRTRVTIIRDGLAPQGTYWLEYVNTGQVAKSGLRSMDEVRKYVKENSLEVME